MNNRNNNLNNQNTLMPSEEIEILDFDEEEKKDKKENKIIIIIIFILLLALLSIPFITNVFKKGVLTSSSISDVKTNKTIDGLLEIGKEEGYIIINKIRFYNFTKRNNNIITVVYLPETTIKNASEENLFIELYNSKKSVIYRAKFDINQKLQRKERGIFQISLNNNLYSESSYGKVVSLSEKDFALIDNSLICTKEDNITTTVTYEFSTNGLVSYRVLKEANEGNAYSFDEEARELLRNNVLDVVYDEVSLSYKVNLIDNSDDSTLYKLSSTYRQVKLDAEGLGWGCKDE